MYRLSSMPTARRWVGRLILICAGVYASSPLSRTLGNRNPDCSASTRCMYSADHGNFAAGYVLRFHSRLGCLLYTSDAADE